MKAPIIGWNYTLAPKCITVIPEYDRGTEGRKRPPVQSVANLKVKRKNNALSAKARRKLLRGIDWLVYSTPWKTVYSTKYKKRYKWKVNLITLTLPQSAGIVSDRDFQKKLLSPVITNLRNNYGLRNYIWKIEMTKAGILHAHLTSDTFIRKDVLRHIWNARLKKCGYLDEWFKNKGNYSPPSTEVASVRNIRNLGGYLANYLAKTSNGKRIIEGRLWGCNYELSAAIATKNFEFSPDIEPTLNNIVRSNMPKKELTSKPDTMGRSHWFGNCFFPVARDWLNDKMGIFKQVFEDTVFMLRTGYEQAPLFAYSSA